MKPIKVAAFVLLLLLVSSPSASAAWPGGNGAIAFSRSVDGRVDGKADIWIEMPSGKQRRLTRTPRASEDGATFSPDGRWIAYEARFRGNANVWLMRSDGTDKRPLVTGRLDALEPAFFPSGRSLAYTVFDHGRGWSVHTVRRDGTNHQRLVGSASTPTVSPNGRLLAYSATSFDKGNGVHLLDLRSGKVRQLIDSGEWPEFSPDGQRIIFGGWRDCRPGGPSVYQLLVMGLRDRRSRFLHRGCGKRDAGAIWSPDGRKILYVNDLPDRNPSAFRLRLGMLTAGGAPAAGAPRHRAGTQEFSPAWQPLP